MLLLTLATLATLVVCQDRVSADDILAGRSKHVKLLTGESIDAFINEANTVTAVMFTSPWCFVCNAILPLWDEAARLLASSNGSIPLFGVIDANRNSTLAELHGIHGLPTMKLFIDQEVFSYVHESPFAPLSASLFVNWVNRHTSRRIVVTSEAQLTEFFKENHLVAVGFFDESEKNKVARDAFAHSSMHFEDVFFVEIADPVVRKAFFKSVQQPEISSFPSVVMVYDHDDKYAVLAEAVTSEAIDTFVRGRRLLMVNVFQPGTIEYILDAGLPMLFLLSPPGSKDENEKNNLREMAKIFIGKVVAVTVGTTQPWELKLAELLDVKEVTIPVVRILTQPPSDHHDHDPVTQSTSIIRHGLKFKPRKEAAAASLEQLTRFALDYLAGGVKPYIRSEPEPEDPKESFTPDSILVNAVGTNFDKLVTQDIQRDILVVYHAPWCGFCRKVMPTLRDLGAKLGHVGKTLKIVKIDATRNEVPNVVVNGYPTIVLYKPVAKEVPINRRPSVDYSGDRSLEHFMEFLHANVANQFVDNRPPVQPAYNSAFEEL